MKYFYLDFVLASVSSVDDENVVAEQKRFGLHSFFSAKNIYGFLANRKFFVFSISRAAHFQLSLFFRKSKRMLPLPDFFLLQIQLWCLR